MMRSLVRLLVFVMVAASSRRAFAQPENGAPMGAKRTLSIDQISGFRVNGSGLSYAGPVGFATQSSTETGFNTTGDTTVKTTTIWFVPSADYFVIDHLSIGGVLEIASQSASSQRPTNANTTQTFDLPTTTSFSFIPRIGYLFQVSDRFGIWPRGGVGYASRQQNSGDADPAAVTKSTIYGFLIDLDVGLLYRPVDPVFFHLGPELTTTLGASHSVSLNNTTVTANASIFQFGVLGGVGVFLDL